MHASVNELGQPVGDFVQDWQQPKRPSPAEIRGQYCSLVRLDADAHSRSLYSALHADESGANWTYLPYGPFQGVEQFHEWMCEQAVSSDPLFFAVVDGSGRALGIVSFLRIAPAMGSIEIGHIHFSRELQGTAAATEALYLLLNTVFGLGYRRCEWKCDALNAASRRAAQRLGFTFEGIFRQAAVVKGRNRDTAWFSMLDQEWPELSKAFQAWLAAENFSTDGRQKHPLSKWMAASQG